MSKDLSLDVFISTYKPIPSGIPQWPSNRQATYPATTATLIAGDRDAILVDSLATTLESRELAGWLTSKAKNLTEVYITHAHADHFFGLNSVLAAFPDARAVTHKDIVPSIFEQTTPGWMEIWDSIFPGQLTEHPIVPEPLGDAGLSIEGRTLRILRLGQSDVSDSSLVHIPDLDTLISGDIVYNGIHPWMYQSTHVERVAWIATLDEVEALGVRTIIAGHKDPDAPDDDARRLVEETRRYIVDFDDVVQRGASAKEIVQFMTARYPRLRNPYTLWLAAASQSPQAVVA
jgi:glyoxylase-like metal-dependent hydrolase (beta-lactamase superfamily II)